MLALQTSGGTWHPPVLGVSAETGHAVGELADTIEAHRQHLEIDDAISQRRARGRIAWAMERFSQRYGALGLERVGGREAAERAIAESSGSALEAFSSLATRAGLEA